MKWSDEHSDIVTIVESFFWVATWIHSSSHIIHPRNSAMSHGDVCWEASPPGRFHLSAKMVGHLWTPSASNYHDVRFPICPGGARWLSIMKQLYALVLLSLGKNHGDNNTRGLKRIWKDNRLKKKKRFTQVLFDIFWFCSQASTKKSFLERKLGFGVQSCRFSCSEVCLYASADYAYWWPCDMQLLNTHLHTPCIHPYIDMYLWYILCICRIYILGCRLPGIFYAWGNQFSQQHWCCA